MLPMISQAMQVRLLAILLTDPDRTTIIRMSTMLDIPEWLLSGAQIGIADAPDSEPACQLRALMSVVQVTIG